MINFTFLNLVQDGCSPLTHKMVISEVQDHFKKLFPQASFLLFNAKLEDADTQTILEDQARSCDILFVVGNQAKDLIFDSDLAKSSRAVVLTLPCEFEQIGYHISGVEAEVKRHFDWC